MSANRLPDIVLPSGAEPVVAILLSVHRGADAGQFAEAIASIAGQTYTRLHLFVYCDGPLDAAHEDVLTRFATCTAAGNTVLRGTKSAGLPSGLNALIEAALAEPAVGLLARMDADDVCVPERIARQVAFMQEHPDIAVAGTWCIEFNRPGVPLFHKRMPTEREEVARSMLLRNALAHPTAMFRREVFERGHRYDPNLLLMQDYELWSRLIVAGERLSNVPEYLLWFRVGDGFFTRRHGIRRAWNEVMLRIRYARRSRLFSATLLLPLAMLFAVRVMPPSLKRLAYRFRR